ncbi:MAG TPA: hypothetical protein VFB52_04425 [Solirubrobacterales bacterium]|nr:hypothetical protein [Solirubrobacterales bacterium]
MAEPLILAQPPAADLDAITPLLTAAFATARDAVIAERPVVVLLDDRDLLGQREVADAALATGLLGLVRALALEGAKPGWRVNAVAHRDEEEAARGAAEWLAGSALSGQLIRVGAAHLGKVSP